MKYKHQNSWIVSCPHLRLKVKTRHGRGRPLVRCGRPKNRPLSASAKLRACYASGEYEAFANRYDLLAPRLFAYLVRRTRDAHKAEDLQQELNKLPKAQREAFELVKPDRL